jgi:hypothetical protein
MGAKRIFTEAKALSPLFQTPDGAWLDAVGQKVELDTDESGIRADAATSLSGIYGVFSVGHQRRSLWWSTGHSCFLFETT